MYTFIKDIVCFLKIKLKKDPLPRSLELWASYDPPLWSCHLSSFSNNTRLGGISLSFGCTTASIHSSACQKTYILFHHHFSYFFSSWTSLLRQVKKTHRHTPHYTSLQKKDNRYTFLRNHLQSQRIRIQIYT